MSRNLQNSLLPCRGFLIMAMATILVCGHTNSASANVWQRLLRNAAKLGDDVPLSKIDDAAERLVKMRQIDEVLDARLARARTADNLSQAARQASRSAEITRMLRGLTKGMDNSLVRQLDNLDDASRATACMVTEGGQRLTAVVPDIAQRARIVKQGGLETVAAIGMFGDEAAHSALRLDAAFRAGRVAGLTELRAAKLADFGALLTRRGSPGWRFWKSSVLPHWKLWAGGGALTALLLAPDDFIDSAGELTEQGFTRLTNIVGKTTASAIRGVAAGSGEAAEDVHKAVVSSYFSNGWKGIYAGIGTLVFLAIVLPWSRKLLLMAARFTFFGRIAK